jgi:hypothetical protein
MSDEMRERGRNRRRDRRDIKGAGAKGADLKGRGIKGAI